MGITITIINNGKQQSVTAENGVLLSELLSCGSHPIDFACKSRGRCGRCRVVAHGTLSPPAESERLALSPEQLAGGLRLACLTRAWGDAVVTLPVDPVYENTVATGSILEFAPAPLYKQWGVALDLGAATISAQLYGPDGFARAALMKNPQAAFGADIMSRIERSIAGQGQALARSAQGAVTRLAQFLADAQGIPLSAIDAYVITGNTAMLYLLAGHCPDAISRAPFQADRLFGEEISPQLLGLPPGARVFLPRCISAFAGADITTGVLASAMVGNGTALLCNIGTNGGLALWHDGSLRCCSTAAGPAFEGAGITMGCYGVRGAIEKVWVENGAIRCATIGGAPATGICTSGIVDAVAALLDTGAVDETGGLQLGGEAVTLVGNVVMTGQDIRTVQLAKGSVRAGMETLLEHAGVGKGQVTRLHIAGCFGSYLNLQSAAAIGLIPAELLPVARVIGNAALSGAAMLLCNHRLLGAARAIALGAEAVALNGNSVFLKHSMEHMLFE